MKDRTDWFMIRLRRERERRVCLMPCLSLGFGDDEQGMPRG